MRKFTKILIFLLCTFTLLSCFAAIRYKQVLGENVIRLHVVANSDETCDQTVKLQVRDAVIAYLNGALNDPASAVEAEAFLQDHLDVLSSVANQALEQAGSRDCAYVSFQKESFPIRKYDTFTLPSGVYRSLRITIGEGNGKNWWCVIFPGLCVPATSEDFTATAVDAGFSPALAQTLTQEYSVRFFFLDCLGSLENFMMELE